MILKFFFDICHLSLTILLCHHSIFFNINQSSKSNAKQELYCTDFFKDTSSHLRQNDLDVSNYDLAYICMQFSRPLFESIFKRPLRVYILHEQGRSYQIKNKYNTFIRLLHLQ